MDDNERLSRRQMLGGVSAGLAAAAIASPAAAQPQHGTQQAPSPKPLAAVRDPQKLYAKPPFPRQSQAWPGLASQMRPRPDHGETSYRGSNRLAGRKALVTGGDSGIGRAAAIAFAREGADVAINYLPAEEPDAREVVALIREAGRKAIAIPGDLRTATFCRRLVATAVDGLGGLDLLVSNAARQHAVDALEQLTDDAFDWTFKTNVYAPFWLTKAALPHMQPGSAIIITASVQAYQPSPNLFDYAQTKAANIAFAKSLAKQLAPRGIRVNAVAPGPFWTPLQVCGGQPTDKLPEFGQDSPLGRPGQPVELAPVYVTLASAESSYSTGQVFGASGGSGVD
jgi:NAD(P)-dependent dehydrogenase (short-subunit alcohol dehydrogenase family)